MLKGKEIGYKQQSFEDSSSEEDEVKATPKARASEQLNLTNAADFGNSPTGRVKVQVQKIPRSSVPEHSTDTDNGCCPKACYSTKCAVTGTVMTLIVTIILIVTLDLAIFGAERYGHRRPYVIDETNTTLVKFELNGTSFGSSKVFVAFEAIPSSDREQLESIELNFVKVGIPELAETLDYAWYFKHLKNLTLSNVWLQGVMPWENYKRYNVPKGLENFHLAVIRDIGRDEGFTLDLCNTCTGSDFNPILANRFNISSILQRHCIESLLFLKRPSDWAGSLAELNYNYFLSVWGWTLLSLNNVTGEVTSTLPYSDELIRNVTRSPRFGPSGVKVIRLRNVKVNVSTIVSLAPTLQVLHLDNVDLEGFQGQRISSILKTFTSLEELTLKFSRFQDSSPPKFEIWLDDLPGSLKSLTLANVILQVQPNSSANFHLTDLNVFGTHLQSDDFLENFPKYFKVKRIAWQVEKFSGSPTKRSSWLSVLVALAMADPDSIYLDKNGSVRLSPTAPPLKLIQLIPPLTFDLGTKAITLSKRVPNLEFLGHAPTGVIDSSPTSTWFKLLKVNAFLDDKFMLEYNW